jgi:hypothetical protein
MIPPMITLLNGWTIPLNIYPVASFKKGLGQSPEFVNLLRSPRIDYQSGGQVRHPYLSYRPDRLHRLAELIPRNQFLGSLNVYKYGHRRNNASQLICVFFICRQRNNYSAPRCFLHDYKLY